MAWNFDLMKDKGGYCNWGDIVNTIKGLPALSREHTLLTTLAYSGRRRGEVRLLRPMDISHEISSIWWNIEKKRGEVKPRVSIPIAARCYYVLNNYITAKKIVPSNFVFTGWDYEEPLSHRHLTRLVTDICKEHNLTTLSGKVPSPHTFRHSFAIHILKIDSSGKSLRMLQYLLQHNDIRTTMFYLQFVHSEYTEYVEKIFNENPELLKEL